MSFLILQKKPREVNKVVMLPVDDIERNPNQPRKYFDPDAIQELSKSIIANGLLQPITVRKKENGKYELIAGERRTLAYCSIGEDFIPAIIEEFDRKQSATLALVENLQRKDLNFFEQAIGIAKLMSELNLTQQQVSEQLGKAQSTIANKLRLLKFPPAVQQRIVQEGLTERHARALLKIQDTYLLDKAVDYIILKRYNVEQTEQYIEKLLSKDSGKKNSRLFIVKDMRMFQNSINKAVSMMSIAGIPIDAKKSESDEFVEYRIKIPKAAIYSGAKK